MKRRWRRPPEVGRWALVALIMAAAGARASGADSGAEATSPPATNGEVRRFALVIGNNAPPRVDLPRLRYADDDAVRWTVLFATLGAGVETLTDLDSESRQLYGQALPSARSPSLAALRAAVARLATLIAGARARGARTVLYFVYAGHGDVEGGRGYVTLTDALFSRADLEAMVLAPAHADTNHVIVDACGASYFLGHRGPGGERRPWQQSYFDPGAARFSNTGFLLSSSSSGLSHEWEEFQAGIFSHEVRSGLLGAADLDGDGRVTYAELTAFVRTANRPVRNERFRPQIVSRAPGGSDDVLLDLRGARGGSLAIGSTAASHQTLEDRAGVRWADFHPGATDQVRLILPLSSWSDPGFYLRSMATSAEYLVPAGSDVKLADLAPRPASLLHRGAIHDAFTHLFELPFDQAALNSFRLEPDLVETSRSELSGADLSPRPIARSVGIAATVAGGVSLVLAAGFAISAARLAGSAEGKSGVDRLEINQEIAARNRWTAITGIVGGLMTATGVALLVWRHFDRFPGDLPAQE